MEYGLSHQTSNYMKSKEKQFDWDKLASLLGPSQGEHPPAGSITKLDFARERNMSITGARDALAGLERQEVLQSALFFNAETRRMMRYFWMKEK